MKLKWKLEILSWQLTEIKSVEVLKWLKLKRNKMRNNKNDKHVTITKTKIKMKTKFIYYKML